MKASSATGTCFPTCAMQNAASPSPVGSEGFITLALKSSMGLTLFFAKRLVTVASSGLLRPDGHWPGLGERQHCTFQRKGVICKKNPLDTLAMSSRSRSGSPGNLVAAIMAILDLGYMDRSSLLAGRNFSLKTCDLACP